MRWTRGMVVAAVLVPLCGCFKMDVNLGDLGGGEGSGKTGGESGPSQLPAPGAGGSWKDVAIQYTGAITLGAEHGAVFYAYDTLAYPGKPIALAVKLLSARDLRPIPGVTVAISQGEWLGGKVTTDANGLATMQWTAPREGNYEFEARIVAVPDESHAELLQVSPAPMLVAARPKNARFVVIDLDHTLVDSSFWRVLLAGAKPMAESVRVTKRIAGAYHLIYLTHRPDLLTHKSKRWLREHGYPPGPLLVSELKDVFDSGEFKTAKLSEVRKAYPNVAMGIGDKITDATAYVDNGLTAYLIPHYKDKPKDMREMARQVRDLRGKRRLQVVSGWREIEQGIFSRRTYPPATFAAMLDNQAGRLEAEERRKDRDDDDDDD